MSLVELTPLLRGQVKNKTVSGCSMISLVVEVVVVVVVVVVAVDIFI